MAAENKDWDNFGFDVSVNNGDVVRSFTIRKKFANESDAWDYAFDYLIKAIKQPSKITAFSFQRGCNLRFVRHNEIVDRGHGDFFLKFHPGKSATF